MDIVPLLPSRRTLAELRQIRGPRSNVVDLELPQEKR